MPGKLILGMIVQTTLWLALMAALLFVPAGNWAWPQGWAFIGIFGLGSAGFIAWLLPRDPELLQSRMKVVQRGQGVWDRLFLFVFIAIWCGWLAFMALDAERWHWSQMPVKANVIGGVLIVAGFLATMVVFKANSFAAPVVRIQDERHQRVIDSGPYAMVRHPMYAAAVLYLFGLPLLLGSKYGLLVPPVFIVGISIRAIFEERLLARELPGYADYMERVPYRLIPYVW